MSGSVESLMFEKKNIQKAQSDSKKFNFRAGDSVAVEYKVKEGVSERVATFRGVCIKTRNKGPLSSFVLRKFTKGIGVEKTILIYSPLVISIKAEKRGRVRRAVLNYLRDIKGAIKIKERFYGPKIVKGSKKNKASV